VSTPHGRWRGPWAGLAVMCLVCGGVVALAFWLLDLYLGDMPSAFSGFVAGALLALVAGLRGRRDARRGDR
jgi:hypothetical protein